MASCSVGGGRGWGRGVRLPVIRIDIAHASCSVGWGVCVGGVCVCGWGVCVGWGGVWLHVIRIDMADASCSVGRGVGAGELITFDKNTYIIADASHRRPSA